MEDDPENLWYTDRRKAADELLVPSENLLGVFLAALFLLIGLFWTGSITSPTNHASAEADRRLEARSQAAARLPVAPSPELAGRGRMAVK